MAITIDWGQRIINVPQADLTALGGTVYELDVDAFRLTLKDLEDDEAGMAYPDTHRHNTEVTLSGVTYARTFEIINQYTVSFENTGTPYLVSCVGANHNLGDVTNFDGGASLLIGNSAGLIVKTVGSGLSTPQDILLTRIGDILEADEEIRATTFKKFLKGTTTPLVSKTVTKVGNDVDLQEP